jgi:hypothetical protein
MVVESPPWIGYTKAMQLARHADGLLVLGVDDAGYVPSKLFTYALSGSPLLACVRADSPVRQYFDRMPAIGRLLTFDSDDTPVSETALESMREFLHDVKAGARFERSVLIADYLSPAMARKHAELFGRVCQNLP